MCVKYDSTMFKISEKNVQKQSSDVLLRFDVKDGVWIIHNICKLWKSVEAFKVLHLSKWSMLF